MIISLNIIIITIIVVSKQTYNYPCEWYNREMNKAKTCSRKMKVSKKLLWTESFICTQTLCEPCVSAFMLVLLYTMLAPYH